MTHTLRLIKGDKQYPTDTLSLSGSTGKIWLGENSPFAPGAGEEIISWSGSGIRFNGQTLIGLSHDNAKIPLVLDIGSSTPAEISFWRREIIRFLQSASRYELSREGDPVWLESRWDDQIGDLQAPVFGQFCYYWQLFLETRLKWPDSLHSGNLATGNVMGVTINLEGAPFWEGLRQKALTAIGRVEVSNYGVLAIGGATNKFTNPAFGHSTWNTGWTASNSALKAIQETRLARSFSSAAKLINTGGSDYTFTQTLTISVTGRKISCIARKLDGSAPTSSDMQMWAEGAALTTTFNEIGDGWYLAWGVFTGSGASGTHGVQVKAGKSIIVDDFLLAYENWLTGYPHPPFNGDTIGCVWSGARHNSESSCPDSSLSIPLGSELSGVHTIAGWFVPYWSSNENGQNNQVIFDYYIDSSNRETIYYRNQAGVDLNQFTILRRMTGTTDVTDRSAVVNLSFLTPVHLAIVQEDDGIRFYVNGVQDTNVNNTATPGLGAGGTLVFGAGTGATWAGGYFDGWRVWDTALTAAQILDDYNNGLPVKQAGGTVGTFPFLWNTDGDGIFDAVDGVVSSTAKDNWGIVGGISGDVPALAEWQITGLDSRVYWLGIKAVEAAFKPNGSLWLDFSGTADSGNSSGDAYESGSYEFDATISADVAVLRGRCQVVGRFRASTAQAIMRPYYRLGGAGAALIEGDDVTVPASTGFLFQDFGELRFDWRENQPVTVDAGLRVREASLYTNLIAFWKLENVNDSGPNGYTLTNNNTVTFSTGKLNNAAYFASASSQYLSRADNANLSTGDVDFTVSCWVYLTNKSTVYTIVAKSGSGQREYDISYDNSPDRFRFLISPDGTNFTVLYADSLGSPSAATWYHIIAWHDSVKNEIGIKINNTYTDTQAYADGGYDGTANFTIGAVSNPALYMNGRIDAVGFWKRILTEEEHTWLYNNGTGLEHPFFSATAALDFLQLLPSPACRVESADGTLAASTDKLIIIGKRAYTIDSGGDRDRPYEHIGDEVNPLPNLYNHIFLLPGHEGQSYPVTGAATVGLYVTPRWLLPGGAVA